MRISLLQLAPVTEGIKEAGSILEQACKTSGQAGVDLLITPEMFMTGYNIGAEAIRAAATPGNGAVVSTVSELAKQHSIAILAGFPEIDNQGHVYNACALVDKTGEVLSICRKTHLYGNGDKSSFTPGDKITPVVEFMRWKIGLAICYDIEFPELVRQHAMNGADAVFCPTANMLPYTSIATRVVPTRAEENEIFVAYANYIGTEREYEYCGLSCIIGPDGEDLARASPDQTEMIFADIHLGTLTRTRQSSTHYKDRRADLYG